MTSVIRREGKLGRENLQFAVETHFMRLPNLAPNTTSAWYAPPGRDPSRARGHPAAREPEGGAGRAALGSRRFADRDGATCFEGGLIPLAGGRGVSESQRWRPALKLGEARGRSTAESTHGQGTGNTYKARLAG